MKKIILTLLTLVTMQVSARECESCTSFNYFTVGTGPVVLIPSIGVGHRSHEGRKGFDISANYSTIFVAHQFQGIAVYHFYPKPFNRNPVYLGAGAAGGIIFTNKHRDGDRAWTIAPDFVIGKEFRQSEGTKNFLEAHVQGPTWANVGNTGFHNKSRLDFPVVYVKYGIGF